MRNKPDASGDATGVMRPERRGDRANQRGQDKPRRYELQGDPIGRLIGWWGGVCHAPYWAIVCDRHHQKIILY